MPHLEARAVSASIDSEVLLAPTSLTVTPGTVLAIHGHNGSGKTSQVWIALAAVGVAASALRRVRALGA